MSHKISVKPGCYGPYAMVAYEHIQEIGVKYLEIDIPENQDLLRDMLDDEDLDFQVGSFIFPINTDEKKIVTNFERACKLCEPFEYEYFFSSTKTNKKNKKHNEKGYKVLQELGDIAQSYGKFISMETHPPYCDNAEEMLNSMKNIDNPGIKINFDTANIYYYSKLEIGGGIDAMKKVLPYIGSFHIKQTNGLYETWYFPELGDANGIVDFKEVFSIMDAANFDGIYTLEMEGTKAKPLKSLSMDEAKENVKKSIDHLRSIGVF